MSQNKNICDHIKLTKRTWNDEREKRQEGKLHRGRPQKLNTEQAKNHGETLELQGNRYYDATTIVQSLDISVARQAKQGDHSHKQSTVFKSANNRTNNYIVPKADEILVDLHKIHKCRVHQKAFKTKRKQEEILQGTASCTCKKCLF